MKNLWQDVRFATRILVKERRFTLAAAEFQVPRVATARGIAEDDVRRIVRDVAEALPLGGGTVVNVLGLNLALDAAP